GDGARAADQGAPAAPLRRERRARQRAVAGLRERAECEQRPVRDVHVPRHPARLSQQLDAALPRSLGQAGLGADDRVLQEARRLTPMRFGLFGSAQARRGGPDVDSGVGFREFVDYNVEAESLGFVSTFLAEHPFAALGQISATLSLLTFIAARPNTHRLAPAVIDLP